MHDTGSSLARALGISKQHLSRYRKKPWFPDLPCTTEQARAAIQKHAQRSLRKVKAPSRAKKPAKPTAKKLAASKPAPKAKKPRAAKKPAAPVQAAPTAVNYENPSPLRLAQDPVSIATAALHVARDRLAAAHEAHRDLGEGFGTRDFEDLKRCLSELDSAREAAEARGELVSRDVARSACATVARMVVEAFDRVTARLAAQVEAWVGDPEWRGSSQKARAIAVREWAERVAGEARDETADRLDKLVEVARAEVTAQK